MSQVSTSHGVHESLFAPSLCPLCLPPQPGDRSDKWLKLKPDYFEQDDMDVLIVGAWRRARVNFLFLSKEREEPRQKNRCRRRTRAAAQDTPTAPALRRR